MANRLARVRDGEVETYFASLRGGPDRSGPAPPLSKAAGPAAEATFGDLCQLYLDDPTASRTNKSQHAYRSSFSLLAELVGATTPLSHVDRSNCRDVMTVLTSLPSNARKRWPGQALRETSAMAKSAKIAPMSAANVNEHMNKLTAMLNWAEREGLLASNPARGLRLPLAQTARERRKAFEPDQLTSIFNAPLYTGCKDDERGYAIQGSSHPKRSRYWVPLLSLFCGLRLNEACQLLTADVRSARDVLCIYITADSGQKTLKTTTSNRYVPVHPILLEFGFEAFLAETRRQGHQRLFPEIGLDAFGMHSGRFSKWFARFLQTCGAARPLTCFHSLRHNFRDGLRNGGVEREVALALGGWTAPSGFTVVGDAYGDGYDPTLLFKAISKVGYPLLDLQHLKTQSA